jgi:hypothetical protein
MPLLEWPKAPIEIVQAFEARRPGRGDVGVLILWAAWTVEWLHYLDDLDSLHHRGHSPIKSHLPEIVNVAHVRWATGSAITALDLCAAALEISQTLAAASFHIGDGKPTAGAAKRSKGLVTAMAGWFITCV